MVKSVSAIVTAVALAAATIFVPSKAEAVAEWVVPTIIAVGFGGAFVGATAASNRVTYAAAPAGNVYVQPTATMRCQIVREQTAAGWRRVEICQ